MKNKEWFRTAKAKLLRFLGINKLIKLDHDEIMWIKLCKGHYDNISPNRIDSLKPMFNKIYAYDADENYDEFINCMFNVLFDIYMKIHYDLSGSNVNLKHIIRAAAGKNIYRQQEIPTERVIAELYGLIQLNTVIVNGIPRYEL